MMLALSTTALADNTTTYSYEIYQIFTGTYSGGTLSNVKWGANGNGTNGEGVDDDTLEALTSLDSTASDSTKLATIKKYANLDSDSTPYVTFLTSDSSAIAVDGTTLTISHEAATDSVNATTTVTDLPDGYYLVKDASDSMGGNDVYTTYVVKVVSGTLTIVRKGTIPTVEKDIVIDEDTTADANAVSIGDTITYKITGTLPSNYEDYTTYYYKFTDTLSKGLTYDEDSANLTVTAYTSSNDTTGTNITSSFTVASTTNTDGTTTLTLVCKDLKAIENLTLTSNSTIVVTYDATLNENAVVGSTDGNKNDVNLTYSNDPNDDGSGDTTPTGTTPDSTVITYTTAITITKTDSSGNTLTGAAFKLTGDSVNVVVVTYGAYEENEEGEGTYYLLSDGTYTTTVPNEANSDSYASTETTYDLVQQTKTVTCSDSVDVTGYVDSSGELTFTGLGAGTYTLSEITTPAGYNTISDITFTVEWSEDDGFSIKEDDSGVAVITDSDNGIVGTLAVTVVNNSGSELPSTGGTGTTVFYIVGAVLVIGAGVTLITRRRVKNED